MGLADGRILVFGHLGSDEPFINGSGAGDVNDWGDIVGFVLVEVYDPVEDRFFHSHKAVMWSYNGTEYQYTLLPELPGTSDSSANGMSDSGLVVGTCGGFACLWDPDIGPVNLNSLLPENVL